MIKSLISLYRRRNDRYSSYWYAKNKKETLSKNAPNVDNQENRGA